ncbi:MAG: Rieske (2Fe-2S) protein [Acidimicrobiales bacterium]
MADRVRVGRLDDLVDGEVVQVDLGGSKAAVARVGDELFAIADRCSHANYSLSEGEVDCDEKTLTCWKHGAEFSLEDGVPLTLPATQPVSVYTVAVDDGDVFVELDGAES